MVKFSRSSWWFTTLQKRTQGLLPSAKIQKELMPLSGSSALKVTRSLFPVSSLDKTSALGKDGFHGTQSKSLSLENSPTAIPFASIGRSIHSADRAGFIQPSWEIWPTML